MGVANAGDQSPGARPQATAAAMRSIRIRSSLRDHATGASAKAAASPKAPKIVLFMTKPPLSPNGDPY